jgi:hypothetical protein
MDLYREVAILHLVRFAPKDLELPAATDWFTVFFAKTIGLFWEK